MKSACRGFMWVALAILTITVLALMVWARLNAARSMSDGIRIRVLDAAGTQTLVTNEGPVTVAVSVMSQVWTNDTWVPPDTELVRRPRFPLVSPVRIRAGDPEVESGVRFDFPERAGSTNRWRVAVLCQKHYGKDAVGQMSEFVARHLTHRGRFGTNDHRGPFDAYLYHEMTGVTER